MGNKPPAFKFNKATLKVSDEFEEALENFTAKLTTLPETLENINETVQEINGQNLGMFPVVHVNGHALIEANTARRFRLWCYNCGFDCYYKYDTLRGGQHQIAQQYLYGAAMNNECTG